MGARETKAAVVDELSRKLEQADAAILVDYRGLDVVKTSVLRRRLRDAGIEFQVVKNTLAFRAAENCGFDELGTFLEGPTAIAFGFSDSVTVAKLLQQFAAETKLTEIKGGLVEKKVYPAEVIRKLAGLPSREVLLGRTAGAISAPLYNLAGVLAGIMRGFVYSLSAVVEQKKANQPA